MNIDVRDLARRWLNGEAVAGELDALCLYVLGEDKGDGLVKLGSHCGPGLEATFTARWAVDYWRPGHPIFEAAKEHASKTHRLIFFVCKTCGAHHATPHDPTRPSLTAVPSTITTARDAKGEHFFTCAVHEGKS